MNILIVEDDPNLRLLWQSVFTGNGHSITDVDTAVDARKLLMTQSFELILLDLYLGHETGLSVAALATYSNPDCKVVIVTGSSTFASGELFDMSPAIASVLRKPVDIEHLVAVCDHIGAGMPVPENVANDVPGLRQRSS
ncbi:MAG: response regulator [Pseudomonadota bacterium]